MVSAEPWISTISGVWKRKFSASRFLSAGGRYLNGVRIEGLNSQPEGKIPLFIKNTNKDVYLRVEEGGITVENAGEGGYSADFGVAQLRVAADQACG